MADRYINKPQERVAYEDSLKYYRDLKNSIDTARDEGKSEGKSERNIEIVQRLFELNEPIEKIAQITGLTIEQIKELKTNPGVE